MTVIESPAIALPTVIAALPRGVATHERCGIRYHMHSAASAAVRRALLGLGELVSVT